MKTKLFLLFLLLVAFSCQRQSDKTIQTCCLSSNDSLLIVNELISITDAYAESNNNIDIDKCAKFYDSSSDFKCAENGVEYANWDSIYSAIKGFFTQPLESVECVWGERSIIPLKPDAATIYGGLSFTAKFKSGEVFLSKGVLSGLFFKKDDGWKLTQSHFSTKASE